jgi:hypothetical protein
MRFQEEDKYKEIRSKWFYFFLEAFVLKACKWQKIVFSPHETKLESMD